MKKIIFPLFKLLCCFLITYNPSFAGTVSLDTSFNNTGYKIQVTDPDGANGRSVAIQPDGKILLGGWTWGPAVYDSFAAMRLNPDGTLDTTFSDDGIVITRYSNFNQVEKLLIQPDAKIILGGTRHFGQNDFAMIRYNSNGLLDTSFDGDGGAASPINGISEDFGKDMVLQNDGKIVMVGNTATDSNAPTDIGIIRRNTNGSLDTSFNGNGIVMVQFQNVDASADSVLIQNDGKIVIGGFVFNGVFNNLLLMRFHSNGFLDTSFGNSGITITPASGSNHSFRTIAQQSDGKILAASKNLIARYSSNGVIDNSFGDNGLATAPQTILEILVQNDDSFLTGGFSGSTVAVSRFNQNGTIDSSFNNTGTVNVTAPGNSCSGISIALQSDNKIVVGGSCFISGLPTFAVFRLEETNQAENTRFDFDGDSKTDIGNFRPAPGEWWYLRSSDGGNNAFQFGQSGDTIVPADFTGDGKTDIAFWRESSGQWFVLRSEDYSFYSYPFGTTGDIPIPGDYDGDGKADSAVFRPADSTWYILNSGGGTTIQQFGLNGDIPIAQDFDGDGKDDIAIFRPSVGEWYYQRSSDLQVFGFQFGTTGDKPVPADYTGDSKADIGFYRPGSGEWFILRSEDNSFFAFPFGTNGDIPVPGDYDGDGQADSAVFRPSNNTWFLNQSTDGSAAVQFGIANDIPIPSAYIP